MPLTMIHPDDLHVKLRRGEPLDLLDVRSPGEHRAVHVLGTRLIPLADLDPAAAAAQRPPQAQGPTYVLCKSGGRAKQAAAKLEAAGVEAIVVEGGTDACVAAGLPVVRGKSVLPLHRQALLGAGLVVWTGLLLAWLVHPWFLAVTAFAGCGLMLAGTADICMMAILLGKMPWNRAASRGVTQANGTVTSCSPKGAAS